MFGLLFVVGSKEIKALVFRWAFCLSQISVGSKLVCLILVFSIFVKSNATVRDDLIDVATAVATFALDVFACATSSATLTLLYAIPCVLSPFSTVIYEEGHVIISLTLVIGEVADVFLLESGEVYDMALFSRKQKEVEEVAN